MRPYKNLLFIILILLISSAIYLCYKIWIVHLAKERAKEFSKVLPSIQLRKDDRSIWVSDSLKYKHGTLVLNYFNPDCEFCENMVKEMFLHKTVIQNQHWLMVTSSTREKTKSFIDRLMLRSLPMVTVLNDTSSQFEQKFGEVSVPTFYVYKNGRLIRKQHGECSIKFLLQP